MSDGSDNTRADPADSGEEGPSKDGPGGGRSGADGVRANGPGGGRSGGSDSGSGRSSGAHGSGARASDTAPRHAVVIGPDGQPVAMAPLSADDGENGPDVGIEEPAKVMRIGTMIKQLLEEVRAAPLDEASRARLKEVHERSIAELEGGLAPELREELERLSLPFTDDSVPSEGELRIAQSQLVGWLEGVFHGLQAALFAQQVAARGQLEQMRRGQLPVGSMANPGGPGGPAGPSSSAEGPQTGQYL
jgi:hypothetical protein